MCVDIFIRVLFISVSQSVLSADKDSGFRKIDLPKVTLHRPESDDPSVQPATASELDREPTSGLLLLELLHAPKLHPQISSMVKSQNMHPETLSVKAPGPALRTPRVIGDHGPTIHHPRTRGSCGTRRHARTSVQQCTVYLSHRLSVEHTPTPSQHTEPIALRFIQQKSNS
jgi:hypothetical protein